MTILKAPTPAPTESSLTPCPVWCVANERDDIAHQASIDLAGDTPSELIDWHESADMVCGDLKVQLIREDHGELVDGSVKLTGSEVYLLLHAESDGIRLTPDALRKIAVGLGIAAAHFEPLLGE